MKKLICLLGTLGLMTSISASVVSCENSKVGLKTIRLSESSTTIEADSTSKITIRNNSELTSVSVVSSNENIATVSVNQSNGVISISGVTVGAATITVSATGFNETTIDVTVNKKEIKLTSPSASITVGDKTTITVINASSLENIEVTSSDTDLATAVYVDGIITLTATIDNTKSGTLKVTVNADKATESTINITIFKQTTVIEVEGSTDIEMVANETNSSITVTNFAELADANLTVTSINGALTTVIDKTNGIITLTAIRGGKYTLKINAKGAIGIDINVTIKEPIVLDLTETTFDLEKGSSKNASITNFRNLGTISLTSDNDFATSTYNKDTGIIEITGNTVGITTFKIEGTYSTEAVTLTVKVTAVDISLSSKIVNLDMVTTTKIEVTIENLESLKNVKATSEDETIAIVTISSEVITISAVGVGTTKIIVTASNGIDKNIDVTVTESNF